MPAAKAVGKELMRSGVATVADVASGEKFKTAAKRRLGEAGSNLRDKLERKVTSLATGDGARKGRRKKRVKRLLKARMNLSNLLRPIPPASRSSSRRATTKKRKKPRKKKKKSASRNYQDIFNR